SLQDVITMQWSMYRYHSSLEATHPFSSPWWSWPLIVRPLWMDVEYLPGGMVSTIVAMGNPCIWWFSLPSLIVSAWKAVRRRDRVSIYIVSVFLFQWMPYVFITRCLFIYHFYMNVPVFILSIADFLKDSWSDRCGRAFVLGYLCVTLFLFVIFYPVISGVAVTHGYKESLRWFSSWLF
ncbi:MAG: phospholipid carrier-dependent glycosyltransferase, partial [Candidatus Bathyarchaeia archaeon]